MAYIMPGIASFVINRYGKIETTVVDIRILGKLFLWIEIGKGLKNKLFNHMLDVVPIYNKWWFSSKISAVLK